MVNDGLVLLFVIFNYFELYSLKNITDFSEHSFLYAIYFIHMLSVNHYFFIRVIKQEMWITVGFPLTKIDLLKHQKLSARYYNFDLST